MMWVLKRVIGVILLILVVGLVSLFFLPKDRIAQIAADQIRNATGRDVSISGDVSMTFWPVLGVRAGGLEVGNAKWSEQGPMLSATNAAIGVDAMSLLRGVIRITNIEAESPTIRLDQRKDGRASWEFSDATGTATIETETTPSKPANPISIERLTITDATLIYDAEGSDLVSYQGVDLKMDWPERLGAADITAVLRPVGPEVRVVATIDGFSGFITGEVRPVRADISTLGGALALNGRASTAGAMAGALTLKMDNIDAFLRDLGLGGADLPQGLGRSIDFSTDMTLTPDRRLSLRDMVADLGGNRLTGAADITLNGIPQINAQLKTGALDLSGGTGGDSVEGASTTGNGTASPAGLGWPTTPIDASGLAAFNGDIALQADSVDLGSIKFGATRVVLKNDRSRMVFELRDVAAYDGNLTGEFVMNNRNGLSVGGSLKARAIEVQPLLNDAAGLTRLTGKGDADLSFLGTGQNVDTIMKSLSGNGVVTLGRGTITGFDLERLMRVADATGGTTVFDSLGATFAIENGVLRNQDLLMLLKNYRADGAGTIDLGQQMIDYVFTPTAVRANSGKGIAIPVRIAGPWADPSIRPDLKAAIDLNLAEQKQELEDRAKTKLREKLQEELGVSDQLEQSIEEVLKDQLEDKLRSIFD